MDEIGSISKVEKVTGKESELNDKKMKLRSDEKDKN